MLTIALELAQTRCAYEDIASKFFEHFISIIDAINTLGGDGLWDEETGFFYDQLSRSDGDLQPLKVRSIVGIIPLYAIGVLSKDHLDKLPGFTKRMNWFLKNKKHLARFVSNAETEDPDFKEDRFIALVPKDRLLRILRCIFDETEFFSDHGVRALSRRHLDDPYQVDLAGQHLTVKYVPAEGDSGMFGGNSNWRGPVWFPVNMLLLNALERLSRRLRRQPQGRVPGRQRQDASTSLKLRRRSLPGWSSSFSVTNRDAGRATEIIPATSATPTGATSSSSASTFTAIPAEV